MSDLFKNSSVCEAALHKIKEVMEKSVLYLK